MKQIHYFLGFHNHYLLLTKTLFTAALIILGFVLNFPLIVQLSFSSFFFLLYTLDGYCHVEPILFTRSCSVKDGQTSDE